MCRNQLKLTRIETIAAAPVFQLIERLNLICC